MEISPFFLNGPSGQLFCLLFTPGNRNHEQFPCIVHVPAFAEEMNNSRKMVAVQARRFAEAGFNVVLFDLYGTGDSAGHFRDATWSRWCDDLAFVLKWVERHYGEVAWLWGMRSGCLLAAEQICCTKVRGALFWQPVFAGYQILDQLHRIRNILARPTDDFTQEECRTLNCDEVEISVEFSGYEISPIMQNELRKAEIKRYSFPAGLKLIWLEVKPLPELRMAAITQQAMEVFLGCDVKITRSVIIGEPFWLTSQLTVMQELTDRTHELISSS